ncbi:Proliferation-associated protein 2G4 [Dispira simplex]|nr:Proliferation-associated protein 2G4 [Dispira simplex]
MSQNKSKKKGAAAATPVNVTKRTIANPHVVGRYKTAAKVTEQALRTVIEACKPGAKVLDLCQLGDRTIQEGLAKEVVSTKITKGISFPTCITPNQFIAHLSPLVADDAAQWTLVEGDVIKIQLGAFVEGYPAMAGHTIVVGQTAVEGRKADVLLAAHYAAEAALRTIKPGNKNNDVTRIVQKIAEEFGTLPVEGMLSTAMEHNKVDGEKSIILNPNMNQRTSHKVEEFKENEVYQVDIIVSSGDGKARESSLRTTVFKNTGSAYKAKMQSAQNLIKEVRQSHIHFPFTLRACQDERKARLGVIECVKSGLLAPYSVYTEKEGEVVAQFQFTALVLPTGTECIIPHLFDPATAKSDKAIKDQAILDLLAA